MIELVDDTGAIIIFDPEAVVAMHQSSAETGQCTVYLNGGHTLTVSMQVRDIAHYIRQALR